MPSAHVPITDLALNILLALGEGPLHGYGIIKDIEDRSGAPSGLRSGTLYTALQRLKSEGLVASAPVPAGDPGRDQRRKYFTMTPLGRQVVASELQRLRSFVSLGVDRRLIEAEGSG